MFVAIFKPPLIADFAVIKHQESEKALLKCGIFIFYILRFMSLLKYVGLLQKSKILSEKATS